MKRQPRAGRSEPHGREPQRWCGASRASEDRRCYSSSVSRQESSSMRVDRKQRLMGSVESVRFRHRWSSRLVSSIDCPAVRECGRVHGSGANSVYRGRGRSSKRRVLQEEQKNESRNGSHFWSASVYVTANRMELGIVPAEHGSANGGHWRKLSAIVSTSKRGGGVTVRPLEVVVPGLGR